MSRSFSLSSVYIGTATSNQIINYITPIITVSMTPTAVIASIGCSFSNNQSFYCVVCCSTDPSVPPDSSVYNISTTRGTEVTVSLQGLTRGQMYYCKAAATNTNSNNCTGPVVGGVKVFFTFMTSSVPITSSSSPTSKSSSSCEYSLHLVRYGEVWEMRCGVGVIGMGRCGR